MAATQRRAGDRSWELGDAGCGMARSNKPSGLWTLDSGPTREFSVCANYNNRYPLPSHQASHLHMRFFLIF